MRLLLDTHAVLWWLESSPLLSERARKLMAKPNNELHFSAVSAWEIEYKINQGKLGRPLRAVPSWDETITQQRWISLSLSHRHAAVAGRLPMSHRDPADRLLAGQAIVEGLTLVSRDPAFANFPVKTLW